MSTKSKRKLPSACVVAMRGDIRALPWTVTVAPGTPAPEGSVTVPAILPVIATCAKAGELNAARQSTTQNETTLTQLRIRLETKYEDRICSPLQNATILDRPNKRTLVPYYHRRRTSATNVSLSSSPSFCCNGAYFLLVGPVAQESKSRPQPLRAASLLIGGRRRMGGLARVLGFSSQICLRLAFNCAWYLLQVSLTVHVAGPAPSVRAKPSSSLLHCPDNYRSSARRFRAVERDPSTRSGAAGDARLRLHHLRRRPSREI